MSVNYNNSNSNIERECITIGRIAPDFTALSTEGAITLSQYRGKWVILLTEPGAFGEVATTSIIELAQQYEEFIKRNVQILIVTIDNNPSNLSWIRDIRDNFGIKVPFPVVADRDADIASAYGIVNIKREYEKSVRDIFIICPVGRIRAILTYPVSCGRNTYELLRLIDSMQLTDSYNVFTPTNWMPGNPVILPTTKTFIEGLIRYDSSMGLFCQPWYSCFMDYNLLINSDTNNLNNSEDTQ